MDFRTRRPIDLAAVAGLVLLALLFVLLLPDGNALRVAVGLPFLLVAPGYALVAALFPARSSLGGLERAALSLGLSIAVVPLLALGLNYTPWGIRLVPVLLAVSALTLLLAAIAWRRRLKVGEAARPEFGVTTNLSWRGLGAADKALVVLAALAVVAAGAAVAYVATAPRATETFTEFYVLGPGGKAEGYPTAPAPGTPATLLVGIVNHEGALREYVVKPRLVNVTYATDADGRLTPTLGAATLLPTLTVPLPDGETFEAPWSFTVPDASPSQLVLDLHADDGAGPYRTLHLWLHAPSEASR